MLAQGLAPGVQHCGHPELAAEAFGIGAEARERGPRRLEEQRVDHLGVEVYPRVEIMRQGDHQVMVGHRQDGRLLPLAPGLRGPALAARTVAVAAGVVMRHLLSAVLAIEPESTERFGAAGEDMMADLPLAGTQPMRSSVAVETVAHHRL